MVLDKIRSNLTAQIILAVFLGIVAGLFLDQDNSGLGEIGKGIVQLIKICATPLLFFTILSSILKTNLGWKSGSRLLIVAGINISIALVIGLTLSNIFRPGENFEKTAITQTAPTTTLAPLKFDSFVKNLIPESLLTPFVKNDVLTIILIALFFGFALKSLRREQGIPDAELSPEWVEHSLRIVEKILGWAVKLIPIAVFAVVAKSFADYGLAPLRGIASYLGIALFGLFLHAVIVYGFWIVRFARIPIREFWSSAKHPVVYAIGVNSSLATLPLTLKALKKLKVSPESSALGAGVATNFNNDGVILYEAMAVLFIAQAHGIHLDPLHQIMAAFTCLVASMGIAGVPEAGFIGLSIVLVTLGLPTEYLPLLLSVDWIIARGRSALNVLSDMTLSIAVDRWGPKRS